MGRGSDAHTHGFLPEQERLMRSRAHFKHALAVLCLLGALAALPASAQNIVTNGNFSANGPGAAVIPTGWTYNVGGSDWGIFNDANSFPGGGNYFWINSAPGAVPTLGQVLNVTPGVTYDISGVYRTLVIGSTQDSFEVRFLNNANNAVLSSSTFDPTGSAWVPFSFTGSFAVANVRLELRAQVGGDSDYAVDNISLVARAASAAPEPGSIALALFGAGGYAGILVRRRFRVG
jgi:hypothetical protein